MSDIKIYGIKNCDTIKKTFKWLNDNNVDYTFHDYKKSGVDIDALKSAIQNLGWETVINQRGTTWRKLDDTTKQNINAESAVDIAIETPSIIKRPLLISTKGIQVGFSEEKIRNLIT